MGYTLKFISRDRLNGKLRTLRVYSRERFPLKNFFPLSAILAASASLAAQAYLYREIKSVLSVFLAFGALFLFFLRLRAFDEFKDFKHDSQYYPERPVPRGLVTLAELKKIIFIALLFEILIATSGGIRSLALFSVALAYSALMLKEFFAAAWLRKHFTLYILSHEALLFPLFFYIFSLNGLRIQHLNQPYFWLLALFLGAQLFLLEVTRKIKPKELEIASRDTYTAQYGIKGASFLAAFLGLAAAVFGILTGVTGMASVTGMAVIPALAFAGLLFLVLRFAGQPDGANAKKLFNASILFVLILNLVFIANILIAI